MQLKLLREIYTDKSTIGRLYVNGNFLCYVLEDTSRGLKQSEPLLITKAKKLFGITAIPTGIYEIIINYSNRFKKYMPLLLSVPAFEGVRIHTGNYATHTEGCLIVGLEKGIDTVTVSRPAYAKLMKILEGVEKEEKITIEIVGK